MEKLGLTLIIALIVASADIAAACGPPTYSCSRTDNSVSDIASFSLPSWGPNTCSFSTATSCGNLTGANTTVIDPAFSNPITRLTDNTYGSATMQVTSGSGDLNRWNTDSTFLSTTKTGGFDYLWSWNGSTSSGHRLYTQKTTDGLKYAGITEFSRATRTKVYLMPSISGSPKTQLGYYDLSNCTTLPDCGTATPPTETSVFDFTSSTNCLGTGFSTTWTDDGGVAANDSAFAETFSNNGGQGGAGAVFVAIYVPSKGCVILNTHTGAITADQGFDGSSGLTCNGSGCTGQLANWTSSFASGFAVHNTKIGRQGDWLVIVPCFGSSPSCGISCSVSACNNVVFWQIATTTWSQPSTLLSGHFTEGYKTWVNAPSTMKFAGRLFTAPSSPTIFTSSISTPIQVHQGWNNADSNDTNPFLLSTFYPDHSAGWTTPYVNEIIGVGPVANGMEWRFAHTYNTNTSTDPHFSIAQVIGSVSQDGKWYMWGSNGMGQFGSESGSASCSLGGTAGGTNCRGEVLIVKLQ